MKRIRPLALVLLTILIVVIPSQPAAALGGQIPVIRSIVPSSAAVGTGQLIIIQGFNIYDPLHPSLTTVTIRQGTTTFTPFLYGTPSNANEIYVRYPNGLVPGAAKLWVTTLDDNYPSLPVAITVVAKPQPPVIRKMVSATDNATPITQAAPGQDIGLQCFGTDTAGASAIFTQGNARVIVPAKMTVDNASIGEVAIFTVPNTFVAGPAFVQSTITVNGKTSKPSFGVLFTVTP